VSTLPWSPTSWLARPIAQDIPYSDQRALQACVKHLQSLPPLVTSWEIERLRAQLADAEAGKRFVLHGGDCAEGFADCRPAPIADKLKVLLQMSMVLVHGLKRPVLRIGRFAGQYAKPRSSMTETRTVDGQPRTLPSYFGDLINRAPFDEASRTPDPALLIAGHAHAATTLNFIRSLVDGGFADLHHPEYWDLSFLSKAGLPALLRIEYERMRASLADGLRFMEALGETTIAELTRVEFFTSHEALSLWYDSSQTRTVPRREGFYNLSTHLPWVGDRTRQLDGAHLEYCRGLQNPVGLKVGPSMAPDELLQAAALLNPANEPGKLVLIARMGAATVSHALPTLLDAWAASGRKGLWLIDPMHGNTRSVQVGDKSIKTRSVDDVLRELALAHDSFARTAVRLGGLHVELTGEDVTECVGGAAGVREQDLTTNYATFCDPRLNYQQAMELAFVIARTFRRL
jgi:3-deoxy-7-phosphoheptulonate synthase